MNMLDIYRKGPRPKTSPTLLTILLSLAICSQIIEKIVGFNIYPMASSLVILSLLLVFKGLYIRLNISLLIVFFTISSHFIIAYVFNPCDFNFKYTFSLFLLLVVFIVYDREDVFYAFSDPLLHYLIVGLTVFFLILSLLGYSIIDLLAYKTRSKIGLYSEYSHLAIFSLPSVLYLFFVGKRLYSIVSFTIIMGFGFSSTAFVFCFIAANLLMYVRFGFFLLSFSLPLVTLIVVFMAFALGMQDTIARVTGIIEAGSNIQDSALSSIVWLNGWSMLYDYLVNTNGLGVGINRMGCGAFSEYGSYTKDIVRFLGMPLNVSDGSFVSSKIISEFGILGFIIVAFFLLKVRNFLSKITFTELIYDNTVSFGFVCCTSILVLLFIRGMGYFNFPFIMCICWMFFSRKVKRVT
ncbi:hypothetical protein CSW98_08835 [Vibrio sp. HA2012]|uniref:hypothetical protein n=1 Tax=Vibrio sp. HA2012 TaxID=1971595 RepID=UPI000C2BEEBC|nr:hypothetical protein [Vibrio sp. HA2012]PJC86314.1 hypothetical protein CSW98_08835 [Vibrio sp. HA2012]